MHFNWTTWDWKHKSKVDKCSFVSLNVRAGFWQGLLAQPDCKPKYYCIKRVVFAFNAMKRHMVRENKQKFHEILYSKKIADQQNKKRNINKLISHSPKTTKVSIFIQLLPLADTNGVVPLVAGVTMDPWHQTLQTFWRVGFPTPATPPIHLVIISLSSGVTYLQKNICKKNSLLWWAGMQCL